MNPSEASARAFSSGDRASTASESTRAWARNVSDSSRAWRERGSDFVVRSWRERPRDKTDLLLLLRRNVITLLFVVVAGIATWELSVDELRVRVDVSGIFPIYLPHAVALVVASIWTTGIVPGNFLGLYGARMYMAWRGTGFTSVNTTVMIVVALLATAQSHVGAYYLRKCLCAPTSGKRVPTIDSVADAVWFLLIVTVCSLIFCTVIAICITITPLVSWAGFSRYWATWWLSVLAAMITVTPMITHLWVWTCTASLRKPAKVVEGIVTALVTLGVLIVIFFYNINSFKPLPYLCFPLITFTAFRSNRVGWALTVCAIAFACALGTIRKRGAVYSMTGRPPVGSTTLLLQVELFSIVMGVVSITLAAAVREKKELTRTLHHMNVELENKVDRRTQELRKANEELQISQKKAEMASHAKSDFLANMSHEIRTPIHGILGLTALLLESELSVDQKESLVSVKECADLLLHIINSVLDLAKIEAGRLEVERVPFNMRKMVSSTFRMMQARAHERGLKMFCEVDRGVPHVLVGDVGKLQQCMLNLVGNALKFTHEGSVSVHVRVASEDLKASVARASLNEEGKVMSPTGYSNRVDDEIPTAVVAEEESMLIHFEVRDTGIGIKQDKLNEMFKPFTQADASTSRLYGGTGLGLCIVHRFVELLGGTIWVESEVGKGSTFHFCLPLFLNTPPKDVGSPDSSPKRAAGKVTKSWSLMGGLVFNQAGTEPDSGAQSFSSKGGSRVTSADDLEGMWTDSTVISIDDSSVGDTVPELKDPLLNLNHNLHLSNLNKSKNKNNNLVNRASLLAVTRASEGVRRARRASASDYEAYKVKQICKAEDAEEPPYSYTRARNSKPVPGNYNGDGDGGASNEVTGGALPAPSGVFLNPDSNTSIKEGVPSDTFDVGSSPKAFILQEPQIRSPPSDLSRESSTELEKMLVSKVHLKILLAEDNFINQKVASRQLEKHGHSVTIVGDGQQALDSICAQHDDFDLVLMDVQMPIMDGLCATEQIRKAEMENGWSRVPILGLTAHAIHGYQDTCLIHGMDGYLGKPFDIQQLLKTIGHILPEDTLNQQKS